MQRTAHKENKTSSWSSATLISVALNPFVLPDVSFYGLETDLELKAERTQMWGEKTINPSTWDTANTSGYMLDELSESSCVPEWRLLLLSYLTRKWWRGQRALLLK